MDNRYRKLRKIAIIKQLGVLFLFLMIVAYFMPTFFGRLPLEFDLARLISNWPLPIFAVTLGFVALYYYGYIIDDIGIAYCGVTKRKGWSIVLAIDWDKILRIEHKPASFWNLFSEKIVIHSLHNTRDTRIIFSDNLVDFKEMVQIVYEKTNVEPDFLGKDLKRVIDKWQRN